MAKHINLISLVHMSLEKIAQISTKNLTANTLS